jgi:hypothetical protein
MRLSKSFSLSKLFAILCLSSERCPPDRRSAALAEAPATRKWRLTTLIMLDSDSEMSATRLRGLSAAQRVRCAQAGFRSGFAADFRSLFAVDFRSRFAAGFSAGFAAFGPPLAFTSAA